MCIRDSRGSVRSGKGTGGGADSDGKIREGGRCGGGSHISGIGQSGLYHRSGAAGRRRHGYVRGERMNKRRVVVTGMGAVTPAGLSVEEFWNSVKKEMCIRDR